MEHSRRLRHAVAHAVNGHPPPGKTAVGDGNLQAGRFQDNRGISRLIADNRLGALAAGLLVDDTGEDHVAGQAHPGRSHGGPHCRNQAGLGVEERWDYVFGARRRPHICTLVCGHQDEITGPRREGQLVIRGTDGEWTEAYRAFRAEMDIDRTGA